MPKPELPPPSQVTLLGLRASIVYGKQESLGFFPERFSVLRSLDLFVWFVLGQGNVRVGRSAMGANNTLSVDALEH